MGVLAKHSLPARRPLAVRPHLLCADVRRASAVALLVGLTLVTIGTLSGTTPVTIIGALVTAATVATIGLAGAHVGTQPRSPEAKPDAEERPPKHLEGMNYRLTDTWDIWER
jgi:hypothetical protein